IQLAKAYLIHKRTDDENSAAGAAQNILRGQGIWKRIGVKTCTEALALVGDAKDEVHAGVLKADGDALGRVVLIAVQYSIDRGLMHRHLDMEALILVQAGVGSQLVSDRFDLCDALHAGGPRKAQPYWLGYAHG